MALMPELWQAKLLTSQYVTPSNIFRLPSSLHVKIRSLTFIIPNTVRACPVGKWEDSAIFLMLEMGMLGTLSKMAKGLIFSQGIQFLSLRVIRVGPAWANLLQNSLKWLLICQYFQQSTIGVYSYIDTIERQVFLIYLSLDQSIVQNFSFSSKDLSPWRVPVAETETSSSKDLCLDRKVSKKESFIFFISMFSMLLQLVTQSQNWLSIQFYNSLKTLLTLLLTQLSYALKRYTSSFKLSLYRVILSYLCTRQSKIQGSELNPFMSIAFCCLYKNQETSTIPAMSCLQKFFLRIQDEQLSLSEQTSCVQKYQMVLDGCLGQTGLSERRQASSLGRSLSSGYIIKYDNLFNRQASNLKKRLHQELGVRLHLPDNVMEWSEQHFKIHKQRLKIDLLQNIMKCWKTSCNPNNHQLSYKNYLFVTCFLSQPQIQFMKNFNQFQTLYLNDSLDSLFRRSKLFNMTHQQYIALYDRHQEIQPLKHFRVQKIGDLSCLNFQFRNSWDRYFMEVCLVLKKRSNCIKMSVGAVVVKQNRIKSTSYNGSPAKNCHQTGCKICWKEQNLVLIEQNCYCVHAECGAILQASKRECLGAKLYSTNLPCFWCAKVIGTMKFEEVIYLDELGKDIEIIKRNLIQSNIKLKRIQI